MSWWSVHSGHTCMRSWSLVGNAVADANCSALMSATAGQREHGGRQRETKTRES